jgi:uncharacterized membrane protein
MIRSHAYLSKNGFYFLTIWVCRQRIRPEKGRIVDILFGEGSGLFVARWLHFLGGIAWIGHLYYFNFVQGAFFSEIDAATKSTAIQKLVPKALWWFRWGAMLTFLSGLYIILGKGHNAQSFEILQSSWGVNILVGSLLGTLMFLNVWLVIWPNQKIVIQSATQAASGGQALPNAAASGAKALLASRTNTMFSIPMLFFMGAAAHLPYAVHAEGLMTFWAVVLVLVAALEGNALFGKLGPLTTVRGVIIAGFVLTAVLFVLVKLLAVQPMM